MAAVVEVLERLTAAGIELLPAVEITTHFIFTRDGFAALVERRNDGFGGMGAPGLLVAGHGLALLVWRGAEAYFIARGFQRIATGGEVESLRRFSDDLKRSISGSDSSSN